MLTKEDLEKLAAVMHDIQYVVNGKITAFSMEFNSGVVAHVEWRDNQFKLSYTEDMSE